jgi:ArsR family transcriptional regulator
LNKPQSTISHHLAILKKANLVNWRKEGKWTHFSLANSKLIGQIENIIEMGESNVK